MNSETSSGLTIAVTGGTGFVGKHLIRQLTADGYSVRALVRKPNSDNNKTEVTWIEGDLSNKLALADLMSGADVVVHAAGAIKALSRAEFFDVNRDGTQAVIDAALIAGVARFVLVSSLAAREPRLSHYAASKRAAELVLEKNGDRITPIILRPPAIYGPGDSEIAPLFQMVANGFFLAPNQKDARVSLIHVSDVVTAIQACFECYQADQPFEIDDGFADGYRWSDISNVAGRAVRRSPKFIPLPALLVRLVGLFGTVRGLITRKPTILTHVKVRELLHRDWRARGPVPPGWKPVWTLEKGFTEAVRWYSSQNILKSYF